MLTLTPAYDLLSPTAGDAPGSVHGARFDDWGPVAADLAAWPAVILPLVATAL